MPAAVLEGKSWKELHETDALLGDTSVSDHMDYAGYESDNEANGKVDAKLSEGEQTLFLCYNGIGLTNTL